ncbi:hypothetical protein ACIQPT_33845 [Streptomyces sp. NPDC091289]|uniref:hypothetical protein n=1 Tax=Streptomyces sp. NPDC091289 TaxID=3365989 RepID=UPI00380DB5E2
MKGFPSWLTFVVSVAAGFVGGEFFGFPWWLRLITVVAVTILMQGAGEIVGRTRAMRKAREEHTGH